MYSYYTTPPENTINSTSAPTGPSVENTSIPYRNYSSCYIVITGSLYNNSESVSRINIYSSISGSENELLATYPTENTTIIYPEVDQAAISQSLISPNSLSFGLNWSLSTSTFPTSSLNSLAIYSGSTPAAYSVYQTTSSGDGFITLDMATTYSIHVSGGGSYYTTSLTLVDNYYGNTLLYLTASNADISYNLSESYNGGAFNTYTLTSTAESFNGILLEYGLSTIPVANSSSVSEWNSLLGISANRVELSSSNVYLLGGTLTNAESLIISSSLSSSIVNVGLEKLSTFGVTDLSILKIESDPNTGTLTEFPSLPGNSISSLIVKYQNITGSTPDLLYYGNPWEIDCSHNQLSGSIVPFTTQSWVLYNYDCSNNSLTGNFPDISILDSLNTFRCNNNQISGSLSNLSPGVLYFDCSNNNITGSIPILTSSTFIQYFNASNNQLSDYSSGSIPNFLTYINAENNILSQSAIEGLVKDVYNAGSTNGYLNLSGSGNSTASIDTLYTASVLEIDRNWQIYLNGASTIFSASFSDNLFGIPVVPGVTDGLSSSYYSIVDTTLPLTYIYLTGSVGSSYKANFAVSDNNIYEVGLGGWTFVSGSSNLYYSCSLSIVEISESVPGTLISFSSNNIPISWSFTGSALCTYLITGSITYSGSYYTDFLLKYAEAIGYGGGGEIP